MPTYHRNYKKVVWGYEEVEAENPEQAQERFDDGLFDEFDNKSEYEREEWEEQTHY